MERSTRLELTLLAPAETAKILARALKPEAASIASKRARVSIEPTERGLRMVIEADDATAMRAAVNSFLRWLDAALQVHEYVSSRRRS